MERATGKIGIPAFCNHQNDKLQLPKSEAFAIKRMLKQKQGCHIKLMSYCCITNNRRARSGDTTNDGLMD